jgi:hypothetical protein
MKSILIFCLLISIQAQAVEVKKQKLKLEKTPKSLFLIKKTKINSDVGEPQFYPMEAQLRTIINDPLLHNTKKFE